MKGTVTIRVQTLVLIAVAGIIALGVLTTTDSSAQSGAGGAWVLQPRASNVEKKPDDAFLFNMQTGEVFLIDGTKKRPILVMEPKKID